MKQTDSIISVIICTRNRSVYLDRALDGIARQTLPSAIYEILVVDNMSTDGTRDLVHSWAEKISNLRYIFEQEVGLSNARNTGLAKASGGYVAYLDDDAIPEPDWLANIAAELERADPMLGLIGGKVLPIWEASRPNWLSDHLVAFLSMIDLGEDRKVLEDSSGIVGANMIISRRALAAAGGFSAKLGRTDTNLLSNEEVMVKQELLKGGYSAVYRPDVVVYHHAPAERLKRSWFLRRLYWQGRSDVVLSRITNPYSATKAAGKFAKVAWWATYAVIRSCLSIGRPSDQMDAAADLAYQLGLMRGQLYRPRSTNHG